LSFHFDVSDGSKWSNVSSGMCHRYKAQLRKATGSTGHHLHQHDESATDPKQGGPTALQQPQQRHRRITKNVTSLYQVSSTKKTWNQSRSDCRQKGADLLIINKQDQIFTRDNMWIGLTDVTNEGSWKWVDGTAMSTRLLSLIRGLTLVLDDESCSLSLLWICEKKLYQ
uniref:C-type lectin domain-containing protein n=1 Tax=Takifugu rubripes TaxID=31033 RepID=A0A674N6T0_TAKRU